MPMSLKIFSHKDRALVSWIGIDKAKYSFRIRNTDTLIMIVFLQAREEFETYANDFL